jgi:hypothetical protein
MEKKDVLDNYPELKELFEEIYPLSKPVMVPLKYEEKFLNPVIQKILEHLLNCAHSITDDAMFDFFTRKYHEYIRFLNGDFVQYCFEKRVNDKEKLKIKLIISFTDEFLLFGFKEIGKPEQEFKEFHKKNFKKFLIEVNATKEDWVANLENQINILYVKAIVNSGITQGSGDSSHDLVN